MTRLLMILVVTMLVGCAGRSTTVAGPSAGWIQNHGGLCSQAESARIHLLAKRFEPVIGRPIMVRVIERDELGAWSWPSGDILLSSGLVARLTDDELIAVIGHEIGHLLADGHLRASVALTGPGSATNVEAAADAASVELLREIGVPPFAMRSALQRVAASQRGKPSKALAQRIARLPS